ncbi:MAG: sugar transferase [Alistipes sp.]|nr:sugar transferase [Alistipes sp.]
MDLNSIKEQEKQNKGLLAHLYYNSEIDTWLAYGASAYALRLYIKRSGFDNLRSYSNELQLPCTMVGSATVRKIRQQLPVQQEQTDNYLCLMMPEPFDGVEYDRWTQKLRDERSRRENLWVETPVSKFVPKDRYIRDGMTSFSRNVKRLGDCFMAFCAMIVFSPLFLICYIAVRREDGGPAIYKQERIGRFGKPFYIYKFRSMRLDAERFGPQLSHSGGDADQRLTKVGRFIRAHHLDELPQLWNVFCGDMAFIGPRPERKYYIDQILEYDKRYTYLYQIRPGVTSYATLYNGYTDTMEKMLRRLEYDLYYLSHRSWWFDFKILFNTFCAIVFGKRI